MDNLSTLPLVRRASTAGPLGADPALLHSDVAATRGHSIPQKMTWTPTATRTDVIRLVARFVQLEFSIRSQAGKFAIHESRSSRKSGVDFDVHSASDVEILDALRTSEIRRRVYAPVQAPIYKSEKTGERLHRVITAREVAPIVRGRATRGVSQIDDAREWRGTVAQKLRRLPSAEVAALITAEKIRLSLRILRNQLTAARTVVVRTKNGGRNARNLKREAEERVSELRSREQHDSDRLKTIVRTRAYRDGLDRLLIACTESEEVERYCFGGR